MYHKHATDMAEQTLKTRGAKSWYGQLKNSSVCVCVCGGGGGGGGDGLNQFFSNALDTKTKGFDSNIIFIIRLDSRMHHKYATDIPEQTLQSRGVKSFLLE